jgi:hypothetical protein
LGVIGGGGHVIAIKVTGDYTLSNFVATTYWDTTFSSIGEISPTQFPIFTAVETGGSYQVIAAPSIKKRVYFFTNAATVP